VRYELDFYILYRQNLACKGLIINYSSSKRSSSGGGGNGSSINSGDGIVVVVNIY
jgi:hypothetical protein